MNPKKVLHFLVFACLLFATGVSPLQTTATAKAQPQLLELAAQAPDKMLRVIAQMAPGAQADEALVARHGGKLTQDLYFINAFAAEMTAEAAVELSRANTVRWVSLDAPMLETGKPCSECVDTSALLGAYTRTVGADKLWNEAPYLQGQGVGVAVVDSGINLHEDFGSSMSGGGSGVSRIVVDTKFNSSTSSGGDKYGHGTHVAGIIAGNGSKSKGAYIGMAPKVNIVNVKVSDDNGASFMSDVVAGLQWIYTNKAAYNIRVVNISLNSSVVESYHTSPLNAAVEILWFNGIVVVVSGGNNGTGTGNDVIYPPANDPFVITVGATNDMGTASRSDDVLATWSACGTTESGFAKPDLVAPGTNIISLLAEKGSVLSKNHPQHRVDGFAGGRDFYFRISGTSMSAPVVSGAVALLLQDEPNLTPDQVKFRLMATANTTWMGSSPLAKCGKYLDAYAAVKGTTTASANTGRQASQLLTTGTNPITWNSVGWNSVGWNTVGWNTVGWNTVGWNTVGWNTDKWDD